MNNKELLRPFDLAQAEAGAAICWSYLDVPITFVGRTVGGNIAIRREDGTIETPCSSSLRMKPLFWKNSRPVYKGDKLWHDYDKKWVTVTSDKLLFSGDFLDENDKGRSPNYCHWEKPKTPVVRYANVYSTLLSSSRYIGELFTTPDGPKREFGFEESIGVARIEWQE